MAHHSHNHATSIDSGRAASENSNISEEGSKSKSSTRGRAKKNSVSSNGRRKADELPAKLPPSKKGKGNNGMMNGGPGSSDEDEDDDDDDDLKTKMEDGGSKSKMTDEEKRKNFLERNRVAALKCRQRKKQWLANLQNKVELFSTENDALSNQITQLKEEVVNLKALLLAHKDCSVTQQHGAYMSQMEPYNTQMNPYAAADLEEDEDFQFVRKSKRPKKEEQDAPKPARKTGRKPKATRESDIVETVQPASESRRSSRRRASGDGEADAPPAVKRATRHSKRLSGDAPDELEGNGLVEGRRRAKGSTRRGDDEVKNRRTSRSGNDRDQAETTSRRSPDEAKASRSSSNNNKTRKTKPAAAIRSSPQQPATSAMTIALPMSDTPVINRNKEMRRKGPSNRRSSLGSRGRRASSLIDSGQAALPHREVDSADFYKHITADGLPEPRRMKQLLMWCGERALSDKPPHGTAASNAILGARAIQDQLLKDFASKSEFSDWFSRGEDGAKVQVILKPNPRNAELDEKMEALEAKIARLREEKRAWLEIRKPPPDLPPLFPDDSTTTDAVILPDFNLLDDDEVAIGRFLADEEQSLAAARTRTEEQLRGIQASLTLQVDELADSVHKLEQRVLVAGDEAALVLRLAAMRLREREDREKESAGTKGMPVTKVLRSLGRILPEGSGG
ncbi:hypothetical protein CDD80_7124 [Ophiocordyceps camponoti-rufipedis]|uniref:BZIP domain-containing protein n=1 Tax=Ophiocordyceps camponoti-rufipedis TaxID=2004952 RepID=A0A2C5YNQ7_9HYPO|nr:hypothetical protein CDD80_7124 [Ophiocordyceps camponoti-rufipedis]